MDVPAVKTRRIGRLAWSAAMVPPDAVTVPANVAANVLFANVRAVPPVPKASTRFCPATEVTELMEVSVEDSDKVPAESERLDCRVVVETTPDASSRANEEVVALRVVVPATLNAVGMEKFIVAMGFV
jgi:hypothetical protein